MLFIDLFNGMYILSNDRFTTLRKPDVNLPLLVRLLGSPPYPAFITSDTFFLEESDRAKWTGQPSIIILPIETNKVLLVSDRIVLLDLEKGTRKVLNNRREKTDQFARLDKTLLKLDSSGELVRLRTDGKPFETCILHNENGTEWKGTLTEATLYSQYPFEDVFVSDGQKLYILHQAERPLHFILRPVSIPLPENCNILAIAYRKSEDILVLGTDSRGVFIYQRKNIKTYIPKGGKTDRNEYF